MMHHDGRGPIMHASSSCMIMQHACCLHHDRVHPHHDAAWCVAVVAPAAAGGWINFF